MKTVVTTLHASGYQKETICSGSKEDCLYAALNFMKDVAYGHRNTYSDFIQIFDDKNTIIWNS